MSTTVIKILTYYLIQSYLLKILITWLSEIYLTSLIALFENFPLLFSHSKNIRMSNLNYSNYYLLIINY